MKLTQSQLETIEYYLLNKGLRFKRFYHEILDHFVSCVEEKMKQGFQFNNAVEEVDLMFAHQKERPNLLRSNTYGIKALETRYFKNQREDLFRSFSKHLIEVLKGYNFLLWLFLIVATCVIVKTDFARLWAISLWLVGLLIPLFPIFKRITLKSFKTWLLALFKSESALTLEERKAKQLLYYGSEHFVLFVNSVSILVMNGLREIPDHYYRWLVLSIMSLVLFPVSLAVYSFELAKPSLNLHHD